MKQLYDYSYKQKFLNFKKNTNINVDTNTDVDVDTNTDASFDTNMNMQIIESKRFELLFDEVVKLLLLDYSLMFLRTVMFSNVYVNSNAGECLCEHLCRAQK